MGHKNASRFFNDPSAIDPQTGQLLYPPPAPPLPPPDPKLLAVQARAQVDAAIASKSSHENRMALRLTTCERFKRRSKGSLTALSQSIIGWAIQK